MGGGEADPPGKSEVNIVLLRSAIEDLIRGRAFYEQQGDGVGDYFEESLAADLEALRLYAGIHPRVNGFHRMLATRFPYAVYYDVVASHVRVRAILDCRRDPKWIRTRLRG